MRTRCAFPYAACLGVIVALADCGGADINAAAGEGGIPASVQRSAFSVRDSQGLASAAGQDLLYISSEDQGSVYVYTYPQRAWIGTLAHLNAAAFGECTDASGDIFITTASQSGAGTIYEYAHGGSSPIETLSDPGAADGCAVDPTSGNLAVANEYDERNPYYSYGGDVAIYAGAKGNPKMYYAHSPRLDGGFFFCSYDPGGNLFVTVEDQYHVTHSLLLQLAKASRTFQMLNLNTELSGISSVQWDGKYVTVTSVGQGKPLLVYRLKLSGSSAKVVDTIPLQSTKNTYTGQVSIEGKTAIGLGAFRHGYESAFFWAYPQGGKFRERIREVGKLPQTLWGIALSIGQPR